MTASKKSEQSIDVNDAQGIGNVVGNYSTSHVETVKNFSLFQSL